jgi:type IV pilus assembly protein PilM
VAYSRIGLDVGATATRAAELVGDDVPALVRAAQVPTPRGAVSGGEVRDPEAVGAMLAELWDRAGFPSRRAVLGVANRRVVVRDVALPGGRRQNLAGSLPDEVRELVPFPLEEAVLDFDPVDEVDIEGRPAVMGLLVAAHRGAVDALISASEAAGIEPVGIDLAPFAVVRAVGADEVGMDLESEGDEVVIDIGAEVTSVTLHDHGVARFVRILPTGGRDTTTAVARGLGTTDEDAERLKRGQTTPGGPAPADARRIALDHAAGLADEIRSALEYQVAQAPGTKVGRVVLTGGGSRLEGLPDVIEERLDAPVEPGRAFGRIRLELEMSEAVMEEAEPLLSVAVGLALPGRWG